MKLLCLDCDSTLSEIEGVDELAVPKGEVVKSQIIDLTNQAMSGEIAIEEIFAKRLDLIQPTKDLCDEVGQLYIEREASGVKEVLDELRNDGWTPIIISGGFEAPIAPFAKYLGISEVYAVPLIFNEDGSYNSFVASPTTRNGGKPEVINELKKKYNPEAIVMVGDGVSDLETQNIVDVFIGYGEFVKREKLKNQSQYFANSFKDVKNILKLFLRE